MVNQKHLFFSILSFLIILLLSNFFINSLIDNLNNKSISAHASSEASVGLIIEGDTSCGDAICNGAETCTTCSTDCGVCASAAAASSGGGGGGGGGGGASVAVPSFKTSKSNTNIRIVSGTSESNEIIVENTGTIPITLIVSSLGISEYIIFDKSNIILAPGESKSLIFTVNAPEPGVYAGKILLTYQGVTQETLVLLNVISEGVLFDATVTIPDLYRVLRAGQRLPVLIELTEVGDGLGVDVTMNYIIKDFSDSTHYTESETFYVQGTKSYSKRFSTKGLKPGDYVLGVELVYPGGFATSSAHFKISDTVLTLQTWLAIIGVFVALMLVFVSIIFFRRKQNSMPKFRRRKI